MEFIDPTFETTFAEKEKEPFYKNAVEYWSHVPPTVDGMLGGFGFISHIDIQGSSQFLKSLFRLKTPPGRSYALDCGAGIGRITKSLLLEFFDKVDLVEQNPGFVEQAQSMLGTEKNMGNFYCSGLQDFLPQPNSYDVIWCQWVLGHLTDEDLTMFLHACKRGLKTNGVIVLKENITSSNQLEEDTVDSSITRPLEHLCRILKKAGLRRIKQRCQEKFPSSLYPVYMIATRPVCALEEEASEPASASDKVSKFMTQEIPIEIDATCHMKENDGQHIPAACIMVQHSSDHDVQNECSTISSILPQDQPPWDSEQDTSEKIPRVTSSKHLIQDDVLNGLEMLSVPLVCESSESPTSSPVPCNTPLEERVPNIQSGTIDL